MSDSRETASRLIFDRAAKERTVMVPVVISAASEESPDGITQDSWGPETEPVNRAADVVMVGLLRIADRKPSPLDRVAITKVIEELNRLLVKLPADIHMLGPDVQGERSKR